MTDVTVRRAGGHVVGLSVSGHAGSALPGDPDLVCAAVSALVQALHIGLTDVLGLEVRAFSDPLSATIEMDWLEGDRRADAVAETILRSLKETAESYPHCLKLTEVS